MISSTFFDLRQIRADLAAFISDDLGYIPLLSEFASFPIDPDADTIENCRRRVERHADILVLVIGGRYGSIDPKTDKSITNLEYLSARTKGIPIYVFIETNILAILPVWRANPSGDFSGVVDTTRLFEFIDGLRIEERVWTYSFTTAQDIMSILRLQLAYLFHESLKLRSNLYRSHISASLERLRPNALRLALERPAAWEYRLFFQSWKDEVEQRADLIWQYREGLRLQDATFVTSVNAREWFLTRTHELQGCIDSAMRLVNVSAQQAFGDPGEPGDAGAIIQASRLLGVLLEAITMWGIRMRMCGCAIAI